jgi:hypothetical protein
LRIEQYRQALIGLLATVLGQHHSQYT